ncbi:MAG: hypothetical protein GX542_02200 [Rhodococcus sp.]|nr:hypothetical protein [Rhodococcus sp. (in: high G+C Gram-positive bacteria)]
MQLEEQVNQLSDLSADVDKSSGEVTDAFDILITGLKATSWIAGPLNIGVALTAEYAETKRAEILAGIDTLSGRLTEALEDSVIPFKFIDDAAEWGKIKASVIEANNDAGKQTLNGYWEGFAFDRYDSAASAQMAAATSAAILCETVITNLEDMARAGLDFYTGVVKIVSGYATSMAAAIAKIATVIEAPWGISDAIDLVAAIVDTFVDLADVAMTFIREQLINANTLSASVLAQDGIPSNKWPKATSDEYDDKESWEAPA